MLLNVGVKKHSAVKTKILVRLDIPLGNPKLNFIFTIWGIATT